MEWGYSSSVVYCEENEAYFFSPYTSYREQVIYVDDKVKNSYKNYAQYLFTTECDKINILQIKPMMTSLIETEIYGNIFSENALCMYVEHISCTYMLYTCTYVMCMCVCMYIVYTLYDLYVHECGL